MRNSTPPFLILAATPGDAPAILALQKRAYASEARLYNDFRIPPLTQTIKELLEEMSGSAVLKAVTAEDMAILGSVRARLEGEVCHVGRLIVEPLLQGRGIGSALLAAVETVYPQAARFELFTGEKSDANIRLYRRHGYVETSRKRLTETLTLVFMSKPRPGA